MSLNGLDTDAVVQAHQTAVTEAGGWFLLKYATRDTVELLANGTGGVNEARSAVDDYQEKSPLYGLVHYRRKRFILKYVPEGTSRLLQVRLAVQFQSILDAFTPYDTVFAFSTAEELSESALGLNTILKSGSKTSSTTSLRQQRLKEIAEDNEEIPSAETMSKQHVSSPVIPVAPFQQEDSDGLPASAARAKAMLAQRRSESRQSAATVSLLDQQEKTVPIVEQQYDDLAEEPSERIVSTVPYPPRTTSISTDKAQPIIPVADAESPVSLSRVISSYQRPSLDLSSPAVESDSDDDIRRPMPKEYHQVPHSNHLTATESSNISRWTDEVVASTQVKHKRAPKPHSDSLVRPKTSSAHEDNNASRRVANLPATVRVSNRASSQQSSRPGSQQSARSMPGRFVPSPNLPPPLPSPTMPEFSERLPSKKARSQASSMMESQAVPPEKLRLMKALQLRKRNQLLAQRSASAGSATIATLNSVDSLSSHVSISGAPQNAVLKRTQPAMIDNMETLITTSPVSTMTASDTQSTKPSSLSEQSPVNRSRTSLSSDTNSSTTPKADNEETIDKTVHQMATSKTEQVASTAEQTVVASEPVVDELLPDSTHKLADDHHVVENVDLESASLRGSRKRYVFDGRINVPASTNDPSEASDDESFMEELQNATVQEAKPMSVNRTPVTPVLAKVPIRETRDWTSSSMNVLKSRTTSHSSQASTPDKRPTTSRAGSTRSLSTALPQWPPMPREPVPVLPKQRPQISAGIVTRVKTFENLGQKEANASTPSPRDPSSRMSTFSNILKRASVISHTPKIDQLEKTSDISLPSPSARDSDEELETLNSRPIVQRPGTTAEVCTPTKIGESVSITARIVRDSDQFRTAQSSAETRGMHWSPLIVEHRNTENHARPTLPRELTTQSADSLPTSLQEKRRFSFSSHKAGSKPLSPTDSRSLRLPSAGSVMKPSRAASECSSMTDEKKGSRASRMLRRLSALGISRSRKEPPATSPTYELPHPETIAEQAETQDPLAMRTVVDIGEVNVQFPETLLWKRRFLRVDDQGFLIFAAPVNDSRSSGKSRKIHLDELLKPALPDREREQMAWSILLDLKVGGTVQCACESGSAQRSFLKMLVDAHSAYNQLYTS